MRIPDSLILSNGIDQFTTITAVAVPVKPGAVFIPFSVAPGMLLGKGLRFDRRFDFLIIPGQPIRYDQKHFQLRQRAVLFHTYKQPGTFPTSHEDLSERSGPKYEPRRYPDTARIKDVEHFSLLLRVIVFLFR